MGSSVAYLHSLAAPPGRTISARGTHAYLTVRLDEGCDMPVTYSIATYTIDVPTGLIITQCVGQVTVAEVQEHFQELARVWPAVDRLDVLLDLTDQSSLPTLRDLEEVATELDAQIGPRRFGRCAVVTPEAIHGSMQMFEVLVGRFFDAIEIFQTESAALMWLMPKSKTSRTLTTQ